MTQAAEIAENFTRFSGQWFADLQGSRAALHGSGQFSLSYARMAAFNGLREGVLAGCGGDCAAFFLEAQNDLLTAHILASLGVWRASLQSLRSFLENALSGLYFSDHPVELRLWLAGKLKLGFSDLLTYFNKHPDVSSVAPSVTGVSTLATEYATLSKAVHSSAVNMRMTGDGSVQISSSDGNRLGPWSSRHTAAVRGVTLLVLTLRKDQLTGTRLLAVRSVLGAILTNSNRSQVRSSLGITIPPYS